MFTYCIQLSLEPSVYTHYLYDAGGNRVKKYTRTAGGNWETITYIDGLIEYREDQDGKIQSINHVMDDTKRIATIRDGYDFGDTTPKIKYNFDDHLGSSNILVDDSGALVNQEEYYPFGETSFGSYAKKRYRFCGKEKDEESGMYYYGARYYSPWLCRFISVDPLAGKYIFQTPYAYADNNPINKMDYNGEGTEQGGGSGEGTSASAGGKKDDNITYSLDGKKQYNLNEGGTWDYGVWNEKTKTFDQHKINVKNGLSFDEQDTLNTRSAINGENAVVEAAMKRASDTFRDTNVPAEYQKKYIDGAIASAKEQYWSNILGGKTGNGTMPKGGPVFGIDIKPQFASGRIEQSNIIFDVVLTLATFGGYAAVRAAMASGWKGLASIGAKKASERAALDVAAKGGMTTVGRWMSKAEYEMMAKTGQMVEGAGGQTFVATGGPGAFNAAAKGSVYAEFQVPTNSLLQGGQANWFKVLGPNSGKAMQGALQKQGGQLLPQIQNLSPILQVK